MFDFFLKGALQYNKAVASGGSNSIQFHKNLTMVDRTRTIAIAKLLKNLSKNWARFKSHAETFPST